MVCILGVKMNLRLRDDIGILIQARSTSERLPNKVLFPLEDSNCRSQTVIEWIYERVKLSFFTKIFYIIPENDKILIKFLEEKQIPYLTGSLHDVRNRFIKAAETLRINYILRVTADNPFVEPLLIEPTLRNLIENNLDLFSFINLPLGVSVEAFTYRALILGESEFNTSTYQEHVSLHIKKHPEFFRFEHREYFPFKVYLSQKMNSFKSSKKERNLQILPRLTMDEQVDYEVFKEVYKRLKPFFSIFDVMDLFFDSPELFQKNLHVHQKVS